jgi:protein phosphatase
MFVIWLGSKMYQGKLSKPTNSNDNNKDISSKKGEDHIIMNSNYNLSSSIVSAHHSDKGKVRENMEDRHHLDEKNGLFILADGMGGHEGGEVASNIAVDAVLQFLGEKIGPYNNRKEKDKENEKTIKKIFNFALKQANQKILDEAENKPELQGMGTTIVFSFIPQYNTNTFYIANIGDSRAYLINPGGDPKADNNEKEKGEKEIHTTIKQLTEDHSVAAEMVRKHHLTIEQARGSKYKHTLTQSLGSSLAFKPYIKHFEWNKGDYLLLCSDGLTDMLDDEEICSIVLEYHRNGISTKEESQLSSIITEEDKRKRQQQRENEDEDGNNNNNTLLDKACKALIEKANEKGGKDNITVILLQNKENSVTSTLDNKNEKDSSKNNKDNNISIDSKRPLLVQSSDQQNVLRNRPVDSTGAEDANIPNANDVKLEPEPITNTNTISDSNNNNNSINNNNKKIQGG